MRDQVPLSYKTHVKW